MVDSALSDKNYKSAPITEAVIGINFAAPINEADIQTIIKKFRTNYPELQTVTNNILSVNVGSDQDSKLTAGINKSIGHRLTTSDLSQLLLLWPTSFTISQLAPYTSWENFLARFIRDWNLLRKITGFQEIKRIGVRYINRIDIPPNNGVFEYEKFLNIYPKMPQLLNVLEQYAMQTISYLKDIDCHLNLNTANISSPLLDHGSFVIDQDIYKETDPPQSDKDIMALLNNIRNQKNLIFESCITDEARALFNQ